METAFNLLDEPWLPVRFLSGEVRELGLIEVFKQANVIAAIAETAPPSLVAEYRLLLAITHRALTLSLGSWRDSDRVRWYQDGLPVDALLTYLEKWRERFWLFHREYPFMQVAALGAIEATREKQKSRNQISLASASGNTPVVFDHSNNLTEKPAQPKLVLRDLLGFLAFVPGGLVQTIREADKAGALANTAAIIPVGETLAQTLMLALHPSPLDGHVDSPAWERAALTLNDLEQKGTVVSGLNDRYTRQSRAILFLPNSDGLVTHLRFAAGFALAEDVQAVDTMASFKSGNKGPIRLTFSQGRAVWRDLSAFLPAAEGTFAKPATVLSWAASLNAVIGRQWQPLLVAGLACHPKRAAKLERWRIEQISLPVKFLADSENTIDLRLAISDAEKLFWEIRKVACERLADGFPNSASDFTYIRAEKLLDSSGYTPIFFNHLEKSLGHYMQLLAEGDIDTANGLWKSVQVNAAKRAWSIVDSLAGKGANALRAEAKYSGRFFNLINPLQLVNVQTSTTEVLA
jgi:CRISPR system Cascade subunit CasA